MKRYDVIAIGELLVDFVSTAITPAGEWPTLQAMPGGAPANFIATCATYGMTTGMIASVGQDFFGDLLIRTLADKGVETSGMTKTDDAFTTLAFVTLDENGDRDFAFSRKPGADTRLMITEDHKTMIQNSRCLHFGTLSMTDEPANSPVKEAVQYAQTQNLWVNFDPNYRAPLWPSKEAARAAMRWGASHCHSIKIGKDELLFLYDEPSYENCLAHLLEEPLLSLAFITNGANGTDFVTRHTRGHVDAFHVEGTIDTTGAGDIFGGAAIAALFSRYTDPFASIPSMSTEDFASIVQFANAAAALSTTKHGGISSIPSFDEVSILTKM